MTNILQLPGWVPTSIDETDERVTIHAVFGKQPDVCQVCGVINAPLYKHGQREVTFLDTPIRKPEKKAMISVKKIDTRVHHVAGVPTGKRLTLMEMMA